MGLSMFSRLRWPWERRRLGVGRTRTRTDVHALLQVGERVLQLAPGDATSQQFTAMLRSTLRLRGVAFYVEDEDAHTFKLASADGTIETPDIVQRDDLSALADLTQTP